MDGLKAIQELNDLADELRSQIKTLAKQGIEQAEAERTYKITLRQEALKLRAEGMPVTLIDKVVLGVPEVADKRLARDIAESKYKATQESINGTKLVLRLIENQIQREWGMNE